MPSTSGLAHALISKRPGLDKNGKALPDSPERLAFYKEVAETVTKAVNRANSLVHDDILTALLDRFTRSDETGKRMFSFEELSAGTQQFYVRLTTDSIDHINRQNQ